MIKIQLLGLLLLGSIYSLTFTNTEGDNISLSSFQGKKILFVNIATNSPKVNQIGSLQQLYQQNMDSLVVVAFPSNSFNNEPLPDTAIKRFCETHYGVTFRIAAKSDMNGSGMSNVYKWLTSASQNGVMNSAVNGDFQKYLVSENGALIAVFNSNIDPLDSTMINAIKDR